MKIIEENDSLDLYNAYLRIKNNIKLKNNSKIKNAEKLISCIENMIIKLKNGKKR